MRKNIHCRNGEELPAGVALAMKVPQKVKQNVALCFEVQQNMAAEIAQLEEF